MMVFVMLHQRAVRSGFCNTNVPDLLSPFAPHIASELWEKMREKFAVTPLT